MKLKVSTITLTQANTSNCKVYNDGSITTFEILRWTSERHSLRSARCDNPLGQIFAEATLTVMPVEDFRPELKHVEPESDLKARLFAIPRLSKRS
uniref:Phage protein n=1 Tax=Macrostomum lignano TaxID=282301 RepID=A0A1I8FNW3_9PLAT